MNLGGNPPSNPLAPPTAGAPNPVQPVRAPLPMPVTNPIQPIRPTVNQGMPAGGFQPQSPMVGQLTRALGGQLPNQFVRRF